MSSVKSLSTLKADIQNFLLNFRDVAQSGSVPAWGAGGREFESHHPDHL